MIDQFRTVYRGGTGEIVEKKSRFIATVRLVESEEEALSCLEALRKKYWDARHNCFVYIIGENQETVRCSDDGEPSGTAGRPMLDVVQGAGLRNVLVVVTRYFGGILLGAGGLVRAYTQGAAMALNAAQVAVMHPTQRLLVDVPYPLLGRFEHFLKSAPVRVEDKAFTDTITFTLCVRSADAEAFQRDLVQHTDGRCEPLVMEEFYAPWLEEDNASL